MTHVSPIHSPIDMRALVICLAFIPCLGLAQSRHSVKVDLSALGQKNLRLAYSFRLNPRSSLELSAGVQKHGNKPDWLYNGDKIGHYLQRKLDTFNYRNHLVNSSGWQNTESQPLPSVSDHFPLYSTQLRFGWRFVFEKPCKRWLFFLQPGISATNLQFYAISTEKRTEAQDTDTWKIGDYPYQMTVIRESALYEQTRSMRLKNKWCAGLGYDIGFARKWGKHLFLEARVNTGATLGTPYKTPRPPWQTRRLWAQPVVMAGWNF